MLDSQQCSENHGMVREMYVVIWTVENIQNLSIQVSLLYFWIKYLDHLSKNVREIKLLEM